jgi:hypothetical protein
MVETWIDAGGRKGREICRKLAQADTRAWGGWIMALAVVLAAIHPLRVHFKRNPHLDAIADEVGSISYMFYRNGETFSVRDAFGLHADTPQINHAGTKVLYCHTSDNGGGAYFHNLVTGEQTLVYEEMASNFFNGPSTDLEVHSWSPDDTRLVYSKTGKNIVVYDVASGQESAALHIP